jgi:glycosyltransferase involved in cell wall biosynthesis
MLFSIIIPTYNRALILRNTLFSVLSQTFPDFEIIVVDDGSTDDTAAVVKELNESRIRYFYKTNEERSVARNFGADRASGQYLIFLDSDDEMKPDHLATISNFIGREARHPEFIFAGYVILNPDKTPLYEYGISGFFNPAKLFYGNFLGCSSVIVKQSLFKQFYFNTDRALILFEDWELWLRIIAHNKLYCFPGKSIVMVNHGARSVLNYSPTQISDKIQHFKNHILRTSQSIKSSLFYRGSFLSGIYSYASLHIAMTKKSRAAAVKYLILALFCNPLLIFKRRFLGIIKQLF